MKRETLRSTATKLRTSPELFENVNSYKLEKSRKMDKLLDKHDQ